MHRLIVTSATYRQSSRGRSEPRQTADPENALPLAPEPAAARRRGHPRRLARGLGPLEPGDGGTVASFPSCRAELSKLSSKGAVWPVSPRR